MLHNHSSKNAQPALRTESNKEHLSPRELDVLEWVCVGKTNWEIGKILGISFCTVKIHVRNILRKLNASNRVQAASIAAHEHLIETRLH
ncbi:hypothetical protein MNBD_GAMMA11-3011 [hydrothermal vent metagenome]|uniref:HTH luxR-type domain-containing protein n=1 Tax=hydrothermal vent metagenome TaxID=652676 RepID=A0A3B0WQY5_9ZZZZ